MADEPWRVPSPVQELAATLEEPPSRYVLRGKDRPDSPLVADDMPEPLPVINLSRLSEDAAEAAKLESALQSWGLVPIVTNGIFKSPVHRVVTNTEKERMSLDVFYGVGAEDVLEPVPGLLDEKRPARYRKVDISDFLAGVHEHFSRGTRFIESLKI